MNQILSKKLLTLAAFGALYTHAAVANELPKDAPIACKLILDTHSSTPTALASSDQHQLTVYEDVNQAALMTSMMTVVQQIPVVDITDHKAVAAVVKLFQDFGHNALAGINVDNKFLDAKIAVLDSPSSPLNVVTADVFKLSQSVQNELDPVTLGRIKDSLVGLNLTQASQQFRQILMSKLPDLSRKNITVRTAYQDIARNIENGISQLETNRDEIARIRANLRKARKAMEDLGNFGKMSLPMLEQTVNNITDPQRKDLFLNSVNRFHKVLTQLSEGATLAAQLDRVWARVEDNFSDAIESAEDALFIALPAHQAVTQARIANAQARRLQNVAAAVTKSKNLAFSALAKELGQAEQERQQYKIDWLKQSLESFEEMAAALIEVETSRSKFNQSYRTQLSEARTELDQKRARMDQATIAVNAVPLLAH